MSDEGSPREARNSATRASISAAAQAHSDLTFRVIGAAMKVHNSVGPGLREIHYQRAMSLALQEAGLSLQDECPIEVEIGDGTIGVIYVDHLVEGVLVVEDKALSHLLTDDEVGQVITYLAITGAPLGLLFNFGLKRLQYKRILPPTRVTDWRDRVRRYAVDPARSHPLIRSSSAVDSARPHPPIRSSSALDLRA